MEEEDRRAQFLGLKAAEIEFGNLNRRSISFPQNLDASTFPTRPPPRHVHLPARSACPLPLTPHWKQEPLFTLGVLTRNLRVSVSKQFVFRNFKLIRH